MPVSPAGLFSLPLYYLNQMVINSASFRTWTGTATPTLAQAYVHYFSAEASAIVRPMAVIGWEPGFSLDSDVGGSRNYFNCSGDLYIIFEATISSSLNEADAAFTFTNNVGAVLKDMTTLSGTAGYLDIGNIKLVEGPYRPHEDEAQTNADYFHIAFSIGWAGVPE